MAEVVNIETALGLRYYLIVRSQVMKLKYESELLQVIHEDMN